MNRDVRIGAAKGSKGFRPTGSELQPNFSINPHNTITQLNYHEIPDINQRKRVRRALRKHSANMGDWASMVKNV